eukprot:Polyplicarium_translucidae@DN2149_c0_g1_i3.p1
MQETPCSTDSEIASECFRLGVFAVCKQTEFLSHLGSQITERISAVNRALLSDLQLRLSQLEKRNAFDAFFGKLSSRVTFDCPDTFAQNAIKEESASLRKELSVALVAISRHLHAEIAAQSPRERIPYRASTLVAEDQHRQSLRQKRRMGEGDDSSLRWGSAETSPRSRAPMPQPTHTFSVRKSPSVQNTGPRLSILPSATPGLAQRIAQFQRSLTEEAGPLLQAQENRSNELDVGKTPEIFNGAIAPSRAHDACEHSEARVRSIVQMFENRTPGKGKEAESDDHWGHLGTSGAQPPGSLSKIPCPAKETFMFGETPVPFPKARTFPESSAVGAPSAEVRGHADTDSRRGEGSVHLDADDDLPDESLPSRLTSQNADVERKESDYGSNDWETDDDEEEEKASDCHEQSETESVAGDVEVHIGRQSSASAGDTDLPMRQVCAPPEHQEEFRQTDEFETTPVPVRKSMDPCERSEPVDIGEVFMQSRRPSSTMPVAVVADELEDVDARDEDAEFDDECEETYEECDALMTEQHPAEPDARAVQVERAFESPPSTRECHASPEVSGEFAEEFEADERGSSGGDGEHVGDCDAADGPPSPVFGTTRSGSANDTIAPPEHNLQAPVVKPEPLTSEAALAQVSKQELPSPQAMPTDASPTMKRDLLQTEGLSQSVSRQASTPKTTGRLVSGFGLSKTPLAQQQRLKQLIDEEKRMRLIEKLDDRDKAAEERIEIAKKRLQQTQEERRKLAELKMRLASERRQRIEEEEQRKREEKQRLKSCRLQNPLLLSAPRTEPRRINKITPNSDVELPSLPGTGASCSAVDVDPTQVEATTPQAAATQLQCALPALGLDTQFPAGVAEAAAPVPVPELTTAASPACSAALGAAAAAVPPRSTPQVRVKRMHRKLRPVGPKDLYESIAISDEEEEGLEGAPRMKTAVWARSSREWREEVDRQRSVDPLTIFGCGSRPAKFDDIFQTPDFRRAAQIAPKRCEEFMSEEGRKRLVRRWETDREQCGFAPHEGVSLEQVRRFKSRVNRHVDVSAVVWEPAWSACATSCDHDSAVRQKVASESPPTATPFFRSPASSMACIDMYTASQRRGGKENDDGGDDLPAPQGASFVTPKREVQPPVVMQMPVGLFRSIWSTAPECVQRGATPLRTPTAGNGSNSRVVTQSFLDKLKLNRSGRPAK